MIREISCQQLLDKQLRFIESWFATPAPDKFVIFEIGTHDQFTDRHIQRAIRLPPLPSSFEEVFQLLRDPVPEAVLYGQNPQDRHLFQWARLLEAAGFRDVFILRGGKQTWAQEGLTLQTGWVPADHFGSPLPEPERRAA
jgi:rhodanese-related sulfurtransferase